VAVVMFFDPQNQAGAANRSFNLGDEGPLVAFRRQQRNE
jgi:hypothetical protein